MSAAGVKWPDEAAREAAAADIQGLARAVYTHLRSHHYKTAPEIAASIRSAPAQVDAALAALSRAGLVESATIKRGVVWRPAAVAIVDPEAAPAAPPEPVAWLETELEAAVADAGHPLHASAVILVIRLVRLMPPDALSVVLKDIFPGEVSISMTSPTAGDSESPEQEADA